MKRIHLEFSDGGTSIYPAKCKILGVGVMPGLDWSLPGRFRIGDYVATSEQYLRADASEPAPPERLTLCRIVSIREVEVEKQSEPVAETAVV